MARIISGSFRSPPDGLVLGQRVLAIFPEVARRAGQRLFEQGVARIVRSGVGEIQGVMLQPPAHSTGLRIQDGRPAIWCSCPLIATRTWMGEGCPHLWATILEAERRGLLVRDEQKPPAWKQRLGALQRELVDQSRRREPWPAERVIDYVFQPHVFRGIEDVQVDICWRQPKQAGGWSRRKLIRQLQPTVLLGLPAEDQSIIGALEWHFGVHHELPAALQASLVPLICQTGRAYLGESETPLVWDDGPAWELLVEVRAATQGYEIHGLLQRPGGERMEIGEPERLLEQFVFAHGSVARVRDPGIAHWVNALKQDGPLLVPQDHADQLLIDLLALPHLPGLVLPPELKVIEAGGPLRPHLKVLPPRHEGEELGAAVSFDYAGTRIRPGHPGEGFDPATRTLLRRDREAEAARLAELGRLGFKRPRYTRPDLDFVLQRNRLPKMVRALVRAGWQVEAQGKLYRQPGVLKLKVRSELDWFDLEGGVDFDGNAVSLPKLLAAIRSREALIPLDDGTFGMLPEEWLRTHAVLAGLAGKAEGSDDAVRFGRSQVGLLDALLAEQTDVAWDAHAVRAREQLRSFAGVGAADPEPGFKGELRAYQREGLGWLQFLQKFGFGGCLADDMGLGKTVQVLALLSNRRALPGVPPSLVVAPRSLVFNWLQEAARFTPHLRVLDHTGGERPRDLERFTDHDLVLTTYGTLRRDAVLFKDFRFDYVVLDEAHAIKNATTESAKAARLLKANHRLVLTGTPVQNHLGDLWSLFEFLNPGMLGAASVFQDAGGARVEDVAAREVLARALRPFILRRTKDRVATDLPEKLEQTLYCELPPEQRKLYDELREHYRKALLTKVDQQGVKRSTILVLEALLRLRQAACHPGLLDPKRIAEPSAKLDLLLPQLQEVLEERHKAIVFSQFTSLLAIVRARLDAAGIRYAYLDGQTTDRQAAVETFQTDPDCGLFLVSLKAGGLGLNLTAAEYVFLLDPWWNPAVEAQAVDRAHRLGQTRRVFAYRIIARGTVEEKVLALQESKRDLADAIISEDNSLIRGLKREDLELLLS